MSSREFAALESIERLLPTTPSRVPEALDRLMRSGSAVKRPLAVARAHRLRAEAHQLMANCPDRCIAELQEAIEIFGVNECHADLCIARGVLAYFLYAKGHYGDAIASGIRGFREQRAPLALRLRAAEGALWPLMNQRQDARARAFAAGVKALADASGDSDAAIGVRSVFALGDFVSVLADAGIASSVFPYPKFPASIRRGVARKRIAAIRDDLASRLGDAWVCAGADPMPAIALATLTAFVDGSAAALPLFERIGRLGGAGARADVLAAQGAAHVLNAEMSAAVPLLRRAIAIAIANGRPFVAAGWQLPLSAAYLQLRQHWDALESLSHYHAAHSGLAAEAGLREVGSGSADGQAAVAVGPAGAPSAPAANVRYLQSEPPYLRKAIKFMQSNYGQRLTVTQIVVAAGASRRSLELAFRQYRNATPLEALRRIRLDAALTLLRSDGVALAQVRSAVGYTSASIFSRDFRRTFGVSPGKFTQVGE